MSVVLREKCKALEHKHLPTGQQQHKSSQIEHKSPPAEHKSYQGFAAGVFSGLAKLSIGHPFDTVKVRLQTTCASQFCGPVHCLKHTLRNEGLHGLYKGVTPPLVGSIFLDSIMMGSLNVYRHLIHKHLYPPPAAHPHAPLPSRGHALAGLLAGTTVSLLAAPLEHVKARLQTQYAARKADRRYRGPMDCARRIWHAHGVRGVYHGLGATLIFRSFFAVWWGSYDVLSRWLREGRLVGGGLSAPAVNFWAGGLSAQCFWLVAYPSDVVKQRIMTDPLGGRLGDGVRRFGNWREAAAAVYRENGVKGYWRGFLPCFMRAFPANAMALVAFEGVMRALP